MNQLTNGFWRADENRSYQLVVPDEEGDDGWFEITVTDPLIGTKHCHYRFQSNYFIVRYQNNTTENYEMLERLTPTLLRIKTKEGKRTYRLIKS